MAEPDLRFAMLNEWVSGQVGEAFAIAPASADASFRRYFRITLPGVQTATPTEAPTETPTGRTLIAMDALPPLENCRPYVAIAGLLRAAGINAPEVFAQDIERGFLLLTDLGAKTYLAALDDGSARPLYRDAIDALVRMQAHAVPDALPPYDRAVLQRELDLFPDWYVARHCSLEWGDADRARWTKGCAGLLANIVGQPRVFVHRDYHSRNLMVCDDNPGVLDFQDALHGPITYDLVSLLKDAYILWDEEFVLDQVARYWDAARRAGLPVDADFAAFYRDFEWMGVQRQLKVLGIFARLYHRDGKPAYLADMPRVASGLVAACERYSALGPFRELLEGVGLTATAPARLGYTF